MILTIQLTNVGDVGTGLADGAVLLHLSGQGSAQVHGARLGFVGLQPEHAGAGELVVSTATRALLLHLHNMDRIPASLDLLGVSISSLLDQDHTW